MQPISFPPPAHQGEPNVELIRRQGWSIGTFSGSYCTAWRGSDEVIVEWRFDGWHCIGGRGVFDEG